jgi:lysophospholipase L1-like esterase
VVPAPPNPYREPQILFASDPQLGFFHLPNQKGWIDDGFATINSLGLRGREVTLPRPKDHFRLVVLGDSIAFGWGVDDDDTFCSRLEQMLADKVPGRKVEVVNTGVSGYDTEQEAALFERFGARLQPDLVLVAFYYNDLFPYLRPDKGGSPADGATQVVPQDPQAKRVLRMTPTASWLQRTLRQSRAFYVAGRGIRWLTTKASERDAGQFVIERSILEGEVSPQLTDAWKRVEGPFRRIRSLAQSLGCPVGIAVMPCREQVTRDCPRAQYQSKVKELGAQLGFFVIDLLPKFLDRRGRVDSLFLPYDRHHPTAAGHRLIAETLCEYLQGHKELLKGSPSSS